MDLNLHNRCHFPSKRTEKTLISLKTSLAAVKVDNNVSGVRESAKHRPFHRNNGDDVLKSISHLWTIAALLIFTLSDTGKAVSCVEEST